MPINYCLSFSLQNVMRLISVTRPICIGAGVFKFVVQLSHSLILVTESSNMAPYGKELSEDLKRRIVALHVDDQGYKKIANSLKLSCSTVAKIIQRLKRAGSTQNRPRVGRPKKLSARAECHIQMLSLKDRRRSPVSIAAEIEEVGGLACSCSDHTPHSISNWCAWLSPQKEASSEDDTQESLQTVSWRHVNKAHGLLEPCSMVWWDED